MTPLHMAASTGNPEVVRAALASNPDVNALSQPNGFTPMHMNIAGTDSSRRQEIVRLLHVAGANLEIKTLDKGLTPLQLAALRGKPLCVAALLQCGANVRALENYGGTALHMAAYKGHTEICRLLMIAGADPRLSDKHGNTPISLAKTQGHTQLCSILSGAE